MTGALAPALAVIQLPEVDVDLEAQVPCQIKLEHEPGPCQQPAEWMFIGCHARLTCCDRHKRYRDRLVAAGWRDQCVTHPDAVFVVRWVAL